MCREAEQEQSLLGRAQETGQNQRVWELSLQVQANETRRAEVKEPRKDLRGDERTRMWRAPDPLPFTLGTLSQSGKTAGSTYQI